MLSTDISHTTLFTVGHSNRCTDELLNLLRSVKLKILVDVRAYPASHRFPQFSREHLRTHLEQVNIQYHWAGRQLGGMRQPKPDSPHTSLAEDGLRSYADHMETDQFQVAARQLMSLATRAPLAIMCAERLPENCHRALIADYLTLKGVRVIHLIDSHHQREHQLNPTLRRESARLVYDFQTQQQLDLI